MILWHSFTSVVIQLGTWMEYRGNMDNIQTLNKYNNARYKSQQRQHHNKNNWIKPVPPWDYLFLSPYKMNIQIRLLRSAMEINCKISISGLRGWVPPRGNHWPIIKHNTSSSLRLISVSLTFVRSLGLIFSGQQRCILERSETDNKDLGHIQSDKFWTETFGWIESRMPGGRMGTSLAALLSTSSTSFPSKKAHSSLLTRVLWQVIHSLRENCNWEIMHAKYLKRGLYDNFLTHGENNWRPKLAA